MTIRHKQEETNKKKRARRKGQKEENLRKWTESGDAWKTEDKIKRTNEE